MPLVRLGRHRVPKDEMSVGAPGQGAPSGVWAGGQLVLKLEEPGREKRVSSRNERDIGWPRAGLKCTCSAIACVRWGGQRDGL